MSCMSGKIIELTMSAGLRKNFRMSRSIMAEIRCRFIKSNSVLSLRAVSAVLLIQVAQIARDAVRRRIAKLASGVIQENVIERSALNGNSADRNSTFARHVHKFAHRQGAAV